MFACNGILFNHESERRGETFVTRKITRGLANIAQGIQDCLFMGNMDSLRDWGHAKDYVRMQWLMMQQDKPDDFVIATGIQVSVREFVIQSAKVLGLTLEFSGEGGKEEGTVIKKEGDDAPSINVGDTIIKVDSFYFRPTEVETLLGDPSKAKSILKWEPEINLDQLIKEMIVNDLNEAKQNVILKNHGFDIGLEKEK